MSLIVRESQVCHSNSAVCAAKQEVALQVSNESQNVVWGTQPIERLLRQLHPDVFDTAGNIAVLVVEYLKSKKFPNNSIVEKLSSPLEIKKWWLYSEWDPKCQFSKYIQKDFHTQTDLHPQNGNAEIKLIESVFYQVRGQYRLWGPLRESGKWRKVVVERLELQWIQDNVEVLFPIPSSEKFDVSALNGLVLWKDPVKKKYQLLEGNHRVSSWLHTKKPEFLPSVIFIGKLSKPIPAA